MPNRYRNQYIPRMLLETTARAICPVPGCPWAKVAVDGPAAPSVKKYYEDHFEQDHPELLLPPKPNPLHTLQPVVSKITGVWGAGPAVIFPPYPIAISKDNEPDVRHLLQTALDNLRQQGWPLV